jgi:hypothetical protein
VSRKGFSREPTGGSATEILGSSLESKALD